MVLDLNCLLLSSKEFSVLGFLIFKHCKQGVQIHTEAIKPKLGCKSHLDSFKAMEGHCQSQGTTGI